MRVVPPLDSTFISIRRASPVEFPQISLVACFASAILQPEEIRGRPELLVLDFLKTRTIQWLKLVSY
jgi:hypothetical protein